MDIKNYLKRKLNLSSINDVQVKRGIHVYQVTKDQHTYYLKHFENEKDANEIKCYDMLSKSDLPLVKHQKVTSTTILLEDMSEGDKYRLGCREDYVNNKVIKPLAAWFKRFHTITKENKEMYAFLEEETLSFSLPDILKCQEYYGSSNFFSLLKDHITPLNNYLDTCEKIGIHDDFYFKNFFVNKETYDVVIFDFNYMKRG